MITLDGSLGEGGGQIIRTALTLSCITGVPVRIDHIRANRKPRGLRAQHLTAIRAAAEICGALVDEVEVGSETLLFEPGYAPRPGTYEWRVGTAGSAALVLQTVLLPLALAPGRSTLRIYGGTHVPGAPSGHYLRDVWVPVLLGLGVDAELYMDSYGWMPEGGGLITAQVRGGARLTGAELRDRGRVERVFGTAVGCNLPSHIPQRMVIRATNLLEGHIEAELDIRPLRTRSVSTGAGLFLTVEYANGRGGFGCLGVKGMPAEAVAERAVTDLLSFHESDAAVDQHLADQLIIPLALAQGPSILRTDAITPHCETNIAVVRAFIPRTIRVDPSAGLVSFD